MVQGRFGIASLPPCCWWSRHRMATGRGPCADSAPEGGGIADCVQYVHDRGFSRVEAEEDAEDAWVRHNNEVADRTLYPLANSWYVGANIPGKPRVFMPYVGGVTAYKRKCDEIAAKGYEGFRVGARLEEQRYAAD